MYMILVMIHCQLSVSLFPVDFLLPDALFPQNTQNFHHSVSYGDTLLLLPNDIRIDRRSALVFLFSSAHYSSKIWEALHLRGLPRSFRR